MRVLYGIKELWITCRTVHPFSPTFNKDSLFEQCWAVSVPAVLVAYLRYTLMPVVSAYTVTYRLSGTVRSLNSVVGAWDAGKLGRISTVVSPPLPAISSKWSSSLLSQITTSFQVHCAYEHDFVLKLCSTIVLTQISLQSISSCFSHCVCNKCLKIDTYSDVRL